MSEKQKIIFLHIPKTAGTSFRHLLEKEYPGNECLYLYYPLPYELNVVKDIKIRLPTAKALYGHIPFGIHKFLGIQGDQYIAFLRDPIQRVISFYNHNARQPGMPYYTAIQEGLSLLEMLEREITIETNNHMTRIITSSGQAGMFDDTVMLEQAIENLNKHFCFIGLTEKFAESISLLSKKLGWKSSHAIPYFNVDPAKHSREIDAKTQAALDKYNRLDKLLYEYVSRTFPSQKF